MRWALSLMMCASLSAMDMDFPDTVVDVVHQGEATEIRVCTISATATTIEGLVDGVEFVRTDVLRTGLLDDDVCWLEREFIFKGTKVGAYTVAIVMKDVKGNVIGRKILELSVVGPRGGTRDKRMTDSNILLMPSHTFKTRDTNKNPAE